MKSLLIILTSVPDLNCAGAEDVVSRTLRGQPS